MTTKNQIYTSLISVGIEQGYLVIPEFKLSLNDGESFKAIDLVWACRRNTNNFPHNLSQYEVKYAFEIEGLDVSNNRLDELIQHFNYLYHEPNAGFIRGITILFDNAYDRDEDWNILGMDYHNKLELFHEKQTHYLNHQQGEHANLESQIYYGDYFVGTNIYPLIQ